MEYFSYSTEKAALRETPNALLKSHNISKVINPPYLCALLPAGVSLALLGERTACVAQLIPGRGPCH